MLNKIFAGLGVALACMIAMPIAAQDCGCQDCQQTVDSACGCQGACRGGCKLKLKACRGCKLGCKSCRPKLRSRLIRCPDCNHQVCTYKTKEVKEKKSCFKIECKTICIPSIKLPWGCQDRQCGRARKVKILKKESFECPKCKCEWEVCKPQVIEVVPEKTPTQPKVEPKPANKTSSNKQSLSAMIRAESRAIRASIHDAFSRR